MKKELILASASPRRKEILTEMGFSLMVKTAEVDESLPDGTSPYDGVRLLAIKKGAAVVAEIGDAVPVLSADTLVELGGVALGKPTDRVDAIRMLSALSGSVHRVHTGVCIHYKGKTLAETATTAVHFRPLSEEEILRYVDSGEPMDKAGAYGIQGGAGAFVSKIEGDFDTVVGLSGRLVKRLLSEALGAKRALSLAEKRRRMEQIVLLLKERYPVAECALKYEGDPWKLLVMGRLSAQCTDERVNEVCKELFAKYKNCEAMASAELSEIEKIIRPCGLYRMKAQSLKEASAMLASEYGGALPSDMESLLRFPGVGRKIANLLIGDIFSLPAVVCDTHCMRICGRLGMYKEELRDPTRIEAILRRILAPEEGSDFCHRIVWFGREVCTARAPKCEECPLAHLCLHRQRALAKNEEND